MKHMIKTTIAKLRQSCPFASPSHSGMLDGMPQLEDVNEAVKRYQRPKDYFTSQAYMGLHERADWQGCPPALRLFVWKYLRALRARALPFYVHTCYRSPASQMRAYEAGHSNLKSGAHQRSAAVDIVCAIDHWDIPEELWYYMGTLGESVARGLYLGRGVDGQPLKVEWGGRWKGLWDPAHFQLNDWKKRPEVQPEEKLTLLPYSDAMRFG